MYQYVIQRTLQGIPGVRNISDNIIVFGSDQNSHDRNLELTLSRLESKGLTLNREKCVFSVPELVFFGFKISADGIAPEDKKIDAVRNERPPQNAAEVRSFLGLVNYCARFIPYFATIAEPLRKLTRSDAEWAWGNARQDAFHLEPLRPTVMPGRPWQDVHIDLCGPFPSGESLLVSEDTCTRWPEVAILRSTTSAAIIGHLRKIFAVHGLPEKVVTDNGANLVSEEFENFLDTQGIQHRKVTPYWPQANAAVERFNRTIEKAIRTAHVDRRTDTFTFLLNYRATPHATTGASPALLHLGRDIRTKVPQVETQLSSAVSAALQSAKVRDQQAKQRMKAYADKRNRASPSDIASGDKVLLKQSRQSKLSTLYDPDPFTVLERRRPSLILQRGDGCMFMRNVSHVHKLHKNSRIREEDDYEMDVDLPQAVNPPRAEEQGVRGSARVRRAPAHLKDYEL